MDNAAYDVFIGFRRVDTQLASKVHGDLQRRGLSVFCDVFHDPLCQLGDGIYEVLRASETFILLLTEEASVALTYSDSWLAMELYHAIKADKKIVVLDMLPTNSPSRSMAWHLPASRVQSIRIYPEELQDIHLQRVFEAVHRGKILPDREFTLDGPTEVDWRYLFAGLGSMANEGTPTSSAVTWFLHELKRMNLTLSRRDVLRMAQASGDRALELLVSRGLVVDIVRAISAAGRDDALGLTDLRPLWPLLKSTFSPESTLPLIVTESSQGFRSAPLFSVVNEGKLRELIRLHLWPSAAGRSRPALVHSHQAYGQSWILAGEITNHDFRVIRSDDLRRAPTEVGASAILHAVRWDGGRDYKVRHQESTLRSLNQYVNVQPVADATFRAGQSYAVLAGDFHASSAGSPSESSVTLFSFSAERGWIDEAPVAWPIDAPLPTSHQSRIVDSNSFVKAVEQAFEADRNA